MQDHNSLFCSGCWPFIVLPLLLTSIVVFFSWQKIERKVAFNTKEILADEFAWAEVENFNRGRDILISGVAPDQRTVEKALAMAQSHEGVRTADFAGQIKPILKPAKISIRFEGDDTIISGSVNSHRAKKSILDDAKAQFGGRHVIDQLLVSNSFTSTPDISGLFATASLLGEGARINIDGDILKVQGKVKNDDMKNELTIRLARAFSGTVENNLVVEIDLHQRCLARVNAHLAANTIHFGSGTSTIQTQSDQVIRAIYETLNGCPEFGFLINGHTDSIGSRAANLELSRQRAQTVVNRLVALGIEVDRLTVNGHGADKPIQSNDTAAGRAQNRRIEFKLKK